MSCDNVKSQEINKTVGNLKRKADLDAMDSFQVISKSKIEEDLFKKQCTWRPPLKTEIEDTDNNSSATCQTKTLEMSALTVNQLSELTAKTVDFSTCSNISKINYPLNNYTSDKEEENENISLGSMETLPTAVFYNNEDFDLKSTDEKNILSQKESEKKFENKEKILSDDENFCPALSLEYCHEKNILSQKESDKMFENKEKILSDEENYCPAQSLENCNEKSILSQKESENKEKILSDAVNFCQAQLLEDYEEMACNNVSLNTGKTDLAEFTCADEAAFLKPTEVNVRLDDECEQKDLGGERSRNRVERIISEISSLADENICKVGGDVVIPEQNLNVAIENPAANDFNIDDTFDLTHSQLAMVEGDVSTAIYQKHLVKSNTNWIRIKQHQKTLLKKLIQQVDQLNNTIVQATNEFKSQLNKPNTYNVCNSSK